MTKDWVHGVGDSSVCQILLQIVVRAVITSSPHAWTSSAGMLLTPADFPFFNDCTGSSTSLKRIGWSFFVSVWEHFSTDGSPMALWLYSSEQYSVHRFSISRSSVRHFPEWSFVGNNEEVQHERQPYSSNQKPLWQHLFNSSIADWFRTTVGVQQRCLL